VAGEVVDGSDLEEVDVSSGGVASPPLLFSSCASGGDRAWRFGLRLLAVAAWAAAGEVVEGGGSSSAWRRAVSAAALLAMTVAAASGGNAPLTSRLSVSGESWRSAEAAWRRGGGGRR
jgi:hypothetical protein